MTMVKYCSHMPEELHKRLQKVSGDYNIPQAAFVRRGLEIVLRLAEQAKRRDEIYYLLTSEDDHED